MDLLMSHRVISSHHDGGEGAQTSRASSPSTPPLPRLHYEVFLSFRGEDTRLNFTDHLYNRLDDKGIVVFRDDEELRVGDKIDQLFEAIKASKISIPVISPGYASSMWCLKELLQILECKQTSGQLVLPIFYKVKPSDVREQKGEFGERFCLFKKKHGADSELVQKLENAFMEVAFLKGWESNKVADGHEGKLVKMVVARIFNELRKAILVVPDFLVGVEDHVKEIKKLMYAKPSNDAKIIAIHGMGGIGKTTLSKVLYNELSNLFEYHSFIPNVREASSKYKGMEDLQKQLISDILVDKSQREISHIDEGITIIEKSFKGKRLLLLLDDVDNKDQLNKLASKNCWFDSESIVIITTRNKEVIVASAVNLSYELNELNFDQSYQLFCNHAFGRDAFCPRDLETIARDIISTTKGLPLAIEIIGKLLYQKSKDFWNATLKKLRRIPDKIVQDKLKISYDALEYEQQQIFLDIACLPIQDGPKYAFHMWDACGFYPDVGIPILISLSLIKVEGVGGGAHIIMHDQLRDLGREIIRKEGCETMGMCSRLWLQEEAIQVIEEKQGTRKVKALILKPPSYSEEIHCTSQQFEGMTYLRFLHMQNVYLTGDFNNLFLNLRWLNWSGQEYDFMEINFNPKKLVILELYHCNITEHWKGWNHIKHLKVLKLELCEHLTTTPDFSAVKELEVLIIHHCAKLRKIHPSIGIFSKTLRILNVSYCEELEELPIEIGKMEELKQLSIDDIGIREIPISRGYMTKLEALYASLCEHLTHIPDSLSSLVKLECLVLGYTPIKCLPTSIGMLSTLQELDLGDCRELESLPNLPCNLTTLSFCGDSLDTLPDISNLTKLVSLNYEDLFERRNRTLNLGKLNQLENLSITHSNFTWKHSLSYSSELIDGSNSAEEINMDPKNFNLLELPLCLKDLRICGCQTLQTLPDFSNLKDLSSLHLQDCSALKEIYGLEGAESLTRLHIERCQKLSKLSGVGTLLMHLKFESLDALQSLPHLSTTKNLKELEIIKCSNLTEIQGLDGVESLQRLRINGCCSLERIGNLSHLKMLARLELCNCEKLSDVQDIEKLTFLTDLSYFGCHPKIKFLDISMLRNLKALRIKDEELMEIPGLQELKNLEDLNISGCKSLRDLPDLSQFPNLKELNVKHCESLTEIQWLENVTSLRKLDIRGCTSLRKLPDLPNVVIESDPYKENVEGELMPGFSQSRNSNDFVEGHCEISLGCLTIGCSIISQMLRSLLTHIRRFATVSQT